MRSSWPIKSTAAEWIGRVYELRNEMLGMWFVEGDSLWVQILGPEIQSQKMGHSYRNSRLHLSSILDTVACLQGKVTVMANAAQPVQPRERSIHSAQLINPRNTAKHGKPSVKSAAALWAGLSAAAGAWCGCRWVCRDVESRLA